MAGMSTARVLQRMAATRFFTLDDVLPEFYKYVRSFDLWDFKGVLVHYKWWYCATYSNKM